MHSQRDRKNRRRFERLAADAGCVDLRIVVIGARSGSVAREKPSNEKTV
jgi:hypothetical protein